MEMEMVGERVEKTNVPSKGELKGRGEIDKRYFLYSRIVLVILINPIVDDKYYCPTPNPNPPAAFLPSRL